MRLWLIFLLLAAAGFAQTAPKRAPAKKAAVPKKEVVAEAPSKWPVEALTVEGNRNYTREQVLAVAGLKVGQLAGKPEFEAARDRLTASGCLRPSDISSSLARIKKASSRPSGDRGRTRLSDAL
jgi:hypothetical protein